jgi:Fic family protein
LKFNKDLPHNALPVLPPSIDIQSKKILKRTINASREIAHLNAFLQYEKQSNYFTELNTLREALANSYIDGITIEKDIVLRALIADFMVKNQRTRDVLNLQAAIIKCFEILKSRPFVSRDLLLTLSEEISNKPGIRSGTIKLTNDLNKIIYTPPVGDKPITELLSNLERFINLEKSIDPLIKIALIHYQLLAIHPFSRGNGRISRLLINLYLQMEGLLQLPVLQMSEVLLKRKHQYFNCLNEVTIAEKWEEWVLFFLETVEIAARLTLNQLKDLLEMKKSFGEKLKKMFPKMYSEELLDILFKQPYVKRQLLIDAGIGTPKTVGNYLIILEKAGIFTSRKVGKEKVYLNKNYLDLFKKDWLKDFDYS